MSEPRSTTVKSLLRQLFNENLSVEGFASLSAHLTNDAAARQIYHEWMDVEIGLAEWSEGVSSDQAIGNLRPAKGLFQSRQWMLGGALAVTLLVGLVIWNMEDRTVIHHVVEGAAPLPSRNMLFAKESFDYPAGRLGFAEGGRGWQGHWSLYKNGLAPALPLVASSNIVSPEHAARIGPLGGHLVLGRATSGFRFLSDKIDLGKPGVYFLSFVLQRVAEDVESRQGMVSVSLSSGGNLREQIACGIDPEGYPFIKHAGKMARTAVSIPSGQPWLFVCKIVSRQKAADQLLLRAYSPTEELPTNEPSVWTVHGPKLHTDDVLDSVHLVAGLRGEFLLDELRLTTSWQSCFVQ